MPDSKITDLTEKVVGAATDEFVINDVAGGNADKKLGMDGIRITESQITNLQSYLTGITGESIGSLSDVTITAAAKGDMLVHNGTAWVDLTVGTDTQVLTADSAEVTGVKWAAPGAASLPVVDTTSIAEGSVDNTKEVRFEVDGNTTGIVGVLATQFTTAKTITFPDATDTLVGLATTDTLTNKTLTTPTIGDFTNATHSHLNAAGGGQITEASISDLQAYLLNITGEPLSDLSDVTITTIGANEILKWSGTAWINNTLAEAGIQPAGTYFDTAGNGLTSSGSTVNAVGTASRISVSADAIDIDSAYVGQTSITTLGTITTGTWTGDAIASANLDADTMHLSVIQTVTGAKTFESGDLIYAGATSGTITLNATAVAGANTLTLPAATDTLVGKATTDTFTNKTFDANGTGNSISNIDVADHSATGTPDATTFYRGDNTWAVPGGSGDMVLASAQTNSGIKTFLDTTMKLRNVANTFDGYFVNTNTADRIYTLPDEAGTISLIGRTETLTGKTLTTPTIGDFTNATHDHTNAAGGGTLLSTSALSDTANIAYLNTANTYTAGTKQSFLADATTAGININNQVPSITTGGDLWRSTDNITYRNNADTADIVITTPANTQTFTNKTIDADGTGNVITNIGSSEIKPEIISGQALVTAVATDMVLLWDATDSQLKRADANDFLTAGSNHDLLSATHSDTTAAAVSRGSIITGQTATPVWQELVIGGANTVLKSDGTDVAWSALTIGTEVTGASTALTDTANIGYLNTANDWGGLNNTNFGTVQADTLEVINAGAGTNPTLTSNSATNNLLLVNDQLSINNVGAGADPIFLSNDAGQVLDLTGSLDISGALTLGTALAVAQGGTGVTTSTGTTNIVLSNSPTLVTPDLGTPSAAVLTNATGLPVSGLANGTDGELITWGTTGVAETVAVGTSGQVLTSNGVGNPPTFQNSAGGEFTGAWTANHNNGGSAFGLEDALFLDPTDDTKGLQIDLAGNTTGITGILDFNFTTAKTITFPDETDTVVLLNATQTLAAKTLTTPTIASFTNATHDHSNAAGGGNLTNTALTSGVFSSITGIGTQSQDMEFGGNNIQNIGVIFMAEQAAADADVTGEGQWWVRNDTDQAAMFTDEAGTDIKVNPQATIQFVIDGGGSTITTGVKGDLEIPNNFTIERVTMLADQSGSIVVDIWEDTYANYPPTDADSITASAVPTITTAVKSQDTTLTGWTTAIVAGSTLRYNVDSATTIQRVTVSLWGHWT